MRRRALPGHCAALAAIIAALAGSARAQEPPSGGGRPVPSPTPLEQVWKEIQRAQQHSTICGSLSETRTSPLLLRPLQLRASFCVQGTTGFRLSYAEPENLTIIYRDKYVNVINGKDRRTEAFEAGAGAARALQYFGPSASVGNIQRDFRTTVDQGPGACVLRMEPITSRFKSRVESIVATFDARDFRIRRLEINGRNGVRSAFDIRIDKVDVPLDPATFEMYRPGTRKERER
jgi:hypothetical protein